MAYFYTFMLLVKNRVEKSVSLRSYPHRYRIGYVCIEGTAQKARSTGLDPHISCNQRVHTDFACGCRGTNSLPWKAISPADRASADFRYLDQQERDYQWPWSQPRDVRWHCGSAIGGTAAILGVWNAYNRIDIAGQVSDGTASWTYSTATWRAANASNGMRASMVVGLQEDCFIGQYIAATANTGGVSAALAGIGYDSTTAPSGRFPQSAASNVSGTALTFNPQGYYAVQPLGFHFMQALEYGGSTWYGDNANVSQTGFTYSGRF